MSSSGRFEGTIPPGRRGGGGGLATVISHGSTANPERRCTYRGK